MNSLKTIYRYVHLEKMWLGEEKKEEKKMV